MRQGDLTACQLYRSQLLEVPDPKFRYHRREAGLVALGRLPAAGVGSPAETTRSGARRSSSRRCRKIPCSLNGKRRFEARYGAIRSCSSTSARTAAAFLGGDREQHGRVLAALHPVDRSGVRENDFVAVGRVVGHEAAVEDSRRAVARGKSPQTKLRATRLAHEAFC